MKILYGIEPDLCMEYAEILTFFCKDVILPKFFYIQLTYLSQANYQVVTDAASTVINSLVKSIESNDLLFYTSYNGSVYFVDEAIYHVNNNQCFIDGNSLLERYLLSLLKISEILESKVIFITSSPEVIRKCRILNFEIGTLEDFSSSGKSWLEPEMLSDIQASITEDRNEIESAVTQDNNTGVLNNYEEIQWQDIRVIEQSSYIQWMDIN
ncbi:hypothetical protein DSM106972_043290 [Dulcicalothrix desertica PCC 7102]|uniref:Uncharacterized protein n=1 Tax=Dulcicalothrix desertica PCC 7102 TaxID=232991 RepID=A0A3S1CMU5_9CYAN|nr:hypothetical protein [Dulcicalothrix desertica]RUT04760.1 hypothetical protein DSM106972_043290 [Dulcicalothrix desertica PCC 7102]TWH42770.1 hypothetical protein CAL7102_06446 [Dulcicalothrix desertica PCC 7102]